MLAEDNNHHADTPFYIRTVTIVYFSLSWEIEPTSNLTNKRKPCFALLAY